MRLRALRPPAREPCAGRARAGDARPGETDDAHQSPDSFAQTPTGRLAPEHFRLTDGAVPVAADGELLLRVRYISLDAANRAWMQGATYRSAVEAGQVMAGGGLAEVVESKAAGFATGDSCSPIPAGRSTSRCPRRAS